MHDTILVIGASGKFAGMIIPELARRDANIRAMVHNPDDVSAVRAAGAQDVAVGDLTDPTSVAAALKDAHRVFYIAPVALPGEAEVGKAFVAAAIAAGLRRFVFSSVIHPVLRHADDLTGAVFFLASPDADFITGQTIIVDSGNEML
jgi:uncharacterized protein YbjT (DUF2867 family)